MKTQLRHQLPSVYQKFFLPEVLNFVINETKATCHSCAMTKERRGARARLTYQEHLKCCTFEPRLPNYLVGDLLRSHQGIHSKGLQNKFEQKVTCFPLAVLPTTEFTKKFNLRKRSDFGNRDDLLCTYYDSEAQQCSVWRSRGSVCTSFFCQSDLGEQGLRFWKILGQFLHHVEMALSEEALAHLDFSPRQMSEQLEYYEPAGEVRPPNTTRWKALWNGYADPQEFYVKTSQFVEKLTREQFEEALGETGLKLERNLLTQIRRIQLKRDHGS